MEIVSTIAGVTSLITSISGFVKTVAEKSNDSSLQSQAIDLNSKIIELQQLVLSIQVSNQEIVLRNNQLEKEKIELLNWESEKAKYELTKWRSDVFVYSLKSDDNTSEPPHNICPKCYSEHKKSIIQFHKNYPPSKIYICHTCKSEFKN